MKTLEQLSLEIRETHLKTQSWRETARPYGIFPAMARMIAKGYNPGKKIRKQLGIQEIAQVVVIEGGSVPDGSQVLLALQCACGSYFIPNHPGRTHCFICRPYRKRKPIR